MNRIVVCVLGMHRSGTSLTMGVLHRLGVYLGAAENLMQPSKDNPEGYFENERIVAIDDRLLARLGGSWDEPPEPPGGWERSPALADLRAEARGFLEREFGGYPLWGWKDPRTCLLVPFWRELVPDARYVLCFRNPLDVAASLAARDGFPLAKSLRLWLVYTAKALADTAGLPKTLISFEDYFVDWDGAVARLAKAAGLDADAAAARSLLRPELRHHGHTLADVLRHPEVPLPAKALYYALGTFAVGGAGTGADLELLATLAGQALAAHRDHEALAAALAALRTEHDLLWETNRQLLDDLERALAAGPAAQEGSTPVQGE